MKAVILAGGKGTRMGDVTLEIPKPMLQVGGKPILLHQIELLKKYHITEIFVLVNYLKDSICTYFGNGSHLGVSITYYEELTPMGTVGGIKEIENQLTEDFIVLYGDVMINMHLDKFIGFHRRSKSECTLVIHPNDHPFDSDLVELDDHAKVSAFYAKPHEHGKYYPNLVNAGAYLFSPSIFKFLEKGKKADFGHDIFPKIFDQIAMFGYNTTEYLKDMGTPARWDEVESDYRSGKINRSSYEYKQKAIFLDRDGVINEEISFISRPEDMRLYEFTPAAIRAINHTEYKAIVITNQSVIARNLCTIAELKIIHNKMETELGTQRAKIDALYYCPHHPDKGYPDEREEYKIDCDCRKPKPGMFLQAAKDFNIDLGSSFMIGDNDRDVKSGKAAGCTTVGVRTGYALKKISVHPDFFFENLKEAVEFILNEPHKILFEQVNDLASKEPSVILVGGNARSGKSTLASYLKWKFEQNGKKVLKIEIDNWILPEKDREHCRNVYDRFQFEQMECDLQGILAGISHDLFTYPNHPDRKPLPLSYSYNGENIVIIEGVVALSSEILRGIAQIKIFVDIEKEEHLSRIRKYYQWRRKDSIEIEAIYHQRLEDEYRLIEKDRTFADFVVNSTLL